MNDLPDQRDADGEGEISAGADVEIHFNGKLCIHSRFCVLQAPDVFKANTPGTWIFPDAMDAPALAAVARNCPSGAITYKSADLRLQEVPPPVNLIRLRENGPYAVHADIKIAGAKTNGLRRTLCRCGASRNKPYCDGSHSAVGFSATGEPATLPNKPLENRSGLLEITPLRDGPLEVKGPVEIVSGTGRTIARTSHCLLCRCGGSSIKPFCDGTHASNGFTDRVNEMVKPAPASPPPSLAEWAGGRQRLAALTTRFYEKVSKDAILAPVFAGMDLQHALHVADFIAEVFGGGSHYSDRGGTHIGMIGRHLKRRITETQRAHWMGMMIETADEIGMPADPAFRDAFIAYLDWGSRLAVINSADGIDAPEGDLPMPTWGWGPPRGPDTQLG